VRIALISIDQTGKAYALVYPLPIEATETTATSGGTGLPGRKGRSSFQHPLV